MKIKHSKYKNTGILFELLTRQITSDTISGGDNKALTILKKYFNSKSELLKEYKIYNALSTKKFKDQNKATILVDTLIEAHSKLNKSRLRREKYNLIKELRSTYDLNNFFKAKITNYGTEASNFSRDPIGQKGTKADIAAEGRTTNKSIYHGLKSSLQKIKKEKQVLKEEEENGLLSEKNIKSKE